MNKSVRFVFSNRSIFDFKLLVYFIFLSLSLSRQAVEKKKRFILSVYWAWDSNQTQFCYCAAQHTLCSKSNQKIKGERDRKAKFYFSIHDTLHHTTHRGRAWSELSNKNLVACVSRSWTQLILNWEHIEFFSACVIHRVREKRDLTVNATFINTV